MENKNICEKLFWSVFRNKYLNKLIFKRSDFKLNVFTYYEMNSVEWMITNKHFSLLREKVMRNDRNLKILFFTLSDPIFELFKDDYEFYNNLFKNYQDNRYISDLTLSDLENFSQKNDNVALLQMLIEKSKDYINLEKFYKFICSGAINSSTYLYNNYFKDCLINDQPQSTNKLWNEAIGYNINLIPKLHYGKRDFCINENYNKKVEFYLNIISKSIPPFSKHLNITPEVKLQMTHMGNPIIFDLSIHELKLNQLIINCKTMSLLLSSSANGQPEFNYSKNDIIEMEELKQLENQFTNSELNCNVSSFSYKNEKVKRLFKMMLPFCGNMQYDHIRIGEILENNSVLFYQMKYYGEVNDVSKKEFLTSSFGYYDRYLKRYFYIQNYMYTCPLKYCLNDRTDRVIPFFKDAIKDILDTSIESNLKIDRKTLIDFAIFLNDFEILQMVYNQLYNTKKRNKKNVGDDELILHENCYNDELDTRIFDFIIYKIPEKARLNILNDIEDYHNLANYFKNSYPKDYKKSILHYKFHFYTNRKCRYIPDYTTNKFMLENHKDFVGNLNQVQIRLDHLIYYHVFHDFKIKPFLTNTNSKGVKVDIKHSPYTLNQGCVTSQLNWVMNNRSQDIKDGTLKISHDEILLAQYLRNNIEETIINDINNSYYQEDSVDPTILELLLDEISDRGDIITIQFLIDQFKNNQLFFDYIIGYSKSSASSQFVNQIDFYNYLNNKY
ncbi:hypothetical protein ACTFIW_009863 [Dictyostelium discoideum]